MQKHLQSCFLLAFIVVTLTACKSLPPRLDSNTLAFEAPEIRSEHKGKLVSEIESNQKRSGIPSRFEIFGNASDIDICRKYTGFLRGNVVVNVSELVGFTFHVDQAGLYCAVDDFQKEYEKRALSSLYVNMHSYDLCLKMTKFAEGKIPLGSTDLTSMEMELNKRQPACWTGSTLANGSIDSDKKNTSQPLNAKSLPKKTELFEGLADTAICRKYDSLFEANNNMSTAERKALRNQIEKRKLNCSNLKANVAERKPAPTKNTVSQAANLERQILAKYGKADEVERFGNAAVFKYCKTGLMGDSYTYVWSDGQSVKQIYKGKWTAPFLCAGAHRSVDWVRTMENSALVLIQPNRRPRKSFGDAMAEAMEQTMQSNQGIYNSLIKGGGDTVTCNKLGDMRFPKQIYTFQGSFCPMGYIQAF